MEVVMAQRTGQHEETTHTNGLAKDVNFTTKAVTNQLKGHPVIQGYALLGGGIALVLFAFGFLPILKWAIVAAGAALAVLGVVRSNIVESTANLIDRFRSKE